MTPEYSSSNKIPNELKGSVKLKASLAGFDWNLLNNIGFLFFKNGGDEIKIVTEEGASDGQKLSARKNNSPWHWVHALHGRTADKVGDSPYEHVSDKKVTGHKGLHQRFANRRIR